MGLVADLGLGCVNKKKKQILLLSDWAPSAFCQLITLFYQHHRSIARFNYNTERIMFLLGIYIVNPELSLR